MGLEIPIRVKCWFCPHKQTVKFSQRNSWDCQSCSQYNGFNKDGDYNKEITGQHSEIPVYPKVIMTWLCKWGWSRNSIYTVNKKVSLKSSIKY